MNKLAEILPTDNIVVLDQASSKKRVFEQASLLLESRSKIARSKIFNALFSREKLGSTGLGNGIAIPHGRVDGIKRAHALFFSLTKPIPFDANDGEPVDLLIFLLVPLNSNDEHLKTLSEIANMFSSEDFVCLLRKTSSPPEMHEIICSWELSLPEVRLKDNAQGK